MSERNTKRRKRLPKWLRGKDPLQRGMVDTKKMLDGLELNTVCQNARCPNIGECYAKKTATFMILGRNCTRNCKFCAVQGETPEPIDPEEPTRIAKAVDKLELKHAVITSVTRDDLEDGGSKQFVKVIHEIRKMNPNVTIEILTPDFNNDKSAINRIIKAKPEIFNHNIETVPSLYGQVRPEADYQQSLDVLKTVADAGDIIVKSGLMLGLGETETELMQVWKDLLKSGCEILTMGQYLQPGHGNIPVKEFIKPEKFEEYKEKALNLGFKTVASGPHVRSSYLAEETGKSLMEK